jgi:hypothetical protein
VATLREIEHAHSSREASRLAVGPASQDERDDVWTVGNDATGGMAFDPSGKRIALGLQQSADRGGNVPEGAVEEGIWIVSASGEEKRHLVPGYPRPFAWSADGTKMAGATIEAAPNGSGANRKLWIVDVGSGEQRTVATLDQPDGADGVLDWSPDGRTILAFTGRTEAFHAWAPSKLEAISVSDGRRAELLTSVAGDFYKNAVYAADGKTIIVQHVLARRPSPSPPGQSMATAPGLPTAELVSIRTDGTGARTLCPVQVEDTLLDWH